MRTLEGLRKLLELENVGIDVSGVKDKIGEHISLSEKLEDTRAKIAALRPGAGFEEQYTRLSKKAESLGEMLQSVNDELLELIGKYRLVAYLEAIPASFDLLEASIAELDTEIISHFRQAKDLILARYALTEKMSTLKGLSDGIYSDYQHEGIAEHGYSIRLPWSAHWSAARPSNGAGLVNSFFTRFGRIASSGGALPGDDVTLLKMLRGWR